MSVSSAVGSIDDSGASRWLEPVERLTARTDAASAASSAAPSATSRRLVRRGEAMRDSLWVGVPPGVRRLAAMRRGPFPGSRILA